MKMGKKHSVENWHPMEQENSMEQKNCIEQENSTEKENSIEQENSTEKGNSTDQEPYMENLTEKIHPREKLLSAIGEIDDNLVSEAFLVTGNRKNRLKWGSLAAMLVLCVSAGLLGIGILNKKNRNTDISDADVYYVDSRNTDASNAGLQNTDSANADNPNTASTSADTPNTDSANAGSQGSGTTGSYLVENSIVILDVNPSIALTVSEDEKVVSAEGLNEDGRAVLNEMDLVDVDITVAVNAVIGSMLQKGYLSDLQNAILVTVENENAEKSAALKERISSIIGTALQDGNLDGSVLSQTLSETADLEQLAQNYGISPGKAALIQEVLSQDPTLTLENLVPLSITEIALIAQSKNLTPDSLAQNGAASDKAYISRESALEIAYGHAGVNAEEATMIKTEFDSEDGIMVYEIEFLAGTTEYEYDINARTGQVVKYEAENKAAARQNGTSGQQPAGSRQPANPQQPAGTQQSSGTQSASGTQQPPGTQSASGTQQPSGTQSASTGSGQTSVGSEQPGSQYIGEDAAKEKALADAGIAADSVKYINAWLEYDDGRPECYEVEFAAGSVEYKYEIDLYSGAVLAQEMEHHGSHENHGNNTENRGSSASSADIGEEAARTAALSHAGLNASQVTKLKTDYDYDDGIAVYEVEFEYNGYEYEYKIDAATGDILKYEMDD
ncbi:MAG TPA: hypothetical protein DCZ91_23030 [Lachnospiraceae bacterium]|nr:hypothetical protein [Lachnospiraceae bacterium]